MSGVRAGRCFPLRAFLIDEQCFEAPFTAIKFEETESRVGERFYYYATECNAAKTVKKVAELCKVWGFQFEELNDDDE